MSCSGSKEKELRTGEQESFSPDKAIVRFATARLTAKRVTRTKEVVNCFIDVTEDDRFPAFGQVLTVLEPDGR